MSHSLENPPDLIAITPIDDQQEEKYESTNNLNAYRKDSTDNDNHIKLQIENNLLQREINQLKSELNNKRSNEYDEQASLVQHRFHQELETIIVDHMAIIEKVSNHVTVHVIDVLQKAVGNIESLRLLHQKELCSLSKAVNNCIEQQSAEMNELLQNLIKQPNSKTLTLFRPLIDHSHVSLEELRRSFDMKLDYLADIHSSKIDSLSSKHQLEMNEMKCELSLHSQFHL